MGIVERPHHHHAASADRLHVQGKLARHRQHGSISPRRRVDQ